MSEWPDIEFTFLEICYIVAKCRNSSYIAEDSLNSIDFLWL